MTKRKSTPAIPPATHKIVTRAVAAERKRGHAAITKAPAKQRR
jgi:hypothetical protein